MLFRLICSGGGLQPSAPLFLIPKIAEKCSFIINCRTGNKRDPIPQPKMQLPSLSPLCQKFVRWSASVGARLVPRHACTFDLKNCYSSLHMPHEAWGTFRVPSPLGVCDLWTLLFGCKMSPPICQRVVARHIGAAFAYMPPPLGLPGGYTPDFDHYLDDVLVVMENNCDWLRQCMRLVSAVMVSKGYKVSDKSVLEPTDFVKWLGKEVDLLALSIANAALVIAKLVACLVITWGSYVPHKTLMRIVGLIGWLGTLATCHLPFLGGACCALFWGRCEWLKMMPRLWLSLASAAFVACPPFRVPWLLISDWRYVKWIVDDVAEFWDASGFKRYRIGMFDPVGGGRALMCPR